MSLTQFWASIRAAWLMIVLMVVVASSITFALASALPEQYTAKARVMLNINSNDPMQYSALKRGTQAAYIATEIHLITDDAVMRDVVTKLGWPDNPQVISEWQSATNGVGDITAWAAAQIARNVAARELEDSSIVEIYYASSSLEAAKQIVGIIRTSYMEQSQKLRADAARRAAAWNRTQAIRALDILQAAETARAAFVKANQIAVDTPAGGLDYQMQLAALGADASRIATSSSEAAPNATAETLRRRLDALDAQIAVFRLRGEQNPATVALEAERATMAQQLARETAVTQGGSGATADQIGLVRAQRDADYLAARLHLLDRSPLYDKLAAMDRDIALKTRRYNAAAYRVASFDTVAAAPSGMQVIGDVIANDTSSYPNVPLMTAIAAGASFALAIAMALLGDLMRRRVRDPEDLRFFASAPVLAVIAATPPPRRWPPARLALGLPSFRRWARIGGPAAAGR